jgi:hypothetical protein
VALLAGLSGANAQAPASGPALGGAGSFPLSFIVPGTNTALHVGGYVELDTYRDSSAFSNSATLGAIDNLGVTSTELEGGGIGPNPPAHTNHGAWRWTAQSSRVDIETRTPSAYGEIKTFIELDFGGSAASESNVVTGGPSQSTGTTSTPITQFSVARLKQAYGTLGPWLFGQAVSNFADLAAWADTLDAPVEAGGFMAVAHFRQQQIRYTQLFSNGISAALSVEANASAGDFATAGTGAGPATWNDFNAPNFAERWPALVGTVRIDQPWGHTAFHAVVAQDRFENTGLTTTVGGAAINTSVPSGGHLSNWGYQLSETGHLNTWGKDKFTWQIQYGQGAGQYTGAGSAYATQWFEGLICSVGPVGTAGTAAAAVGGSVICSTPRVAGINAGYSHWWNDTWRSGLGAGFDMVSRPNAAGDWGDAGITAATANALSTLARKDWTVSANLMWTPVPGVQLGIEDEQMFRTVWSGAHGGDNRVKGQALFSF